MKRQLLTNSPNNCSACGAPLKCEKDSPLITCSYCGQQFILDSEVFGQLKKLSDQSVNNKRIKTIEERPKKKEERSPKDIILDEIIRMEGFDPSDKSLPFSRITSTVNEDQVKLRHTSGVISAIYNKSRSNNSWIKKDISSIGWRKYIVFFFLFIFFLMIIL